MSFYSAHMSGDCNPPTCPACAAECDVCGQWLPECSCPTLPIDTEDQP